MRTMIRVTIPAEAGSAAIRSGRLPQLMGDMLARLKPEAAYFTADKGYRTGYFFVDLKEPSDIPGIAEPFFQELNATVEFQPVMNADDLKAGLGKLSK